MLGLGSNIIKSPSSGATIITDNLVLRHQYAVNPVQPLSDGAAYFVSSGSDYIDCGSASNLDVGTGDFSVSAWFKVSTKGGSNYHDIVTKGNTLGDGVGWGINVLESNKTIYFDTDGDTRRETVTSPTSSWDFNKWYHLVGTRSNSTDTLKLYIDGVLVGTNTSATNDDLGDASINFEIGSGLNNRYANGYICNVGYWNAVLDQAQIKSIMWKKYSDLTSSETADLVSWWNLDEETATDGTAGTGGVKDHKGSNHGTLS